MLLALSLCFWLLPAIRNALAFECINTPAHPNYLRYRAKQYQSIKSMTPLQMTDSVEETDADGFACEPSSMGFTNSTASSRSADGAFDLDRFIDETGLKHVKRLPQKRPVSPTDIFCNRELKMGAIGAIGFDMDYTLATYKQPAFDKLAFDGAKEKLVTLFGYPEKVLQLQYDHTKWSRGLIIDTMRGNFLKIDRHKYVRVAYHGFEPISPLTRKHLYSRNFNKVMSFTEKHFVNMDTLFQFVDAHLYACLIDLKDNGEYAMLDAKTYEEMYRDMRECVDLCHRDGVIKDEVARNPSAYIVNDRGTIPMLRRLRDDGLKIFLLTNSYWEYTSTAMNFLYYGERVDDEVQTRNDWLELFDLVIVGSCKPAFFLDPYLNLFRVRSDGSLRNTDGVYEIDALGQNGASKFLSKGKTFQGGNWLHLQALLETKAGEEILYVGDHLYADVLRSKRTLGWRSAFIIPELEDELRTFHDSLPLLDGISAVRKIRDELGLYSDAIRRGANRVESGLVYQSSGQIDSDTNQLLREIEKEDETLKGELSRLAGEWHSNFHPVWGGMFNSGYQDSRLAFYVQNYACLYTSKASNFGLVSRARSFRTHQVDMLSHDKLLADASSVFLRDSDPWSCFEGDVTT